MTDSTSPNADVRMRGFVQRVAVEQAWAWIDASLPPLAKLPKIEVALDEAAGRILADDVFSTLNVPSFARSMMDGFALHSEDTYGCTPYNPLPLNIRGRSLPGQPFSETLQRGEAIRIMTGAPLPAGADAVLPVEQTELARHSLLARHLWRVEQTELARHLWRVEQTELNDSILLARGEVSPGKHVGQVGEDIQAGEKLLPAGRWLRPQDIGVLASIGIASVPVIKRPVVRIIVTGNELLPAGTMPTGYNIADANGPMLSALVARDGGEVSFAGIVPDDPAAIREALFFPADVVLVSGGSSVGEEDHVPRIIAELGELAIHGIAMRPSSPAGMGRLENRLVFLLPGNPVSCLCAYDFFAGRAIRSLAGLNKDWPYRSVRSRLTRKLVSVVGRVDYARMLVQGNCAEPLAIGGAAILSSTTRATGFVIIPADSEGYAIGAEVEVFLYCGVS